MRNDLCILIIGLVFVVLISVLAVLYVEKENSKQDKLWNGGVCTECGGNYQFKQAIGHINSTSYIYQCDQCGRLIELYGEINE